MMRYNLDLISLLFCNSRTLKISQRKKQVIALLKALNVINVLQTRQIMLINIWKIAGCLLEAPFIRRCIWIALETEL